MGSCVRKQGQQQKQKYRGNIPWRLNLVPGTSFPLRDVGDVKCRGCRKLKGDTQVTVTAHVRVNMGAWAAVLLLKENSSTRGILGAPQPRA